MGKINFGGVKPIAIEIGKHLSKSLNVAVRWINNHGIIVASASLIPSAILIPILIKKQEEKERLYVECVKKHQAIISALSDEVDMSKERQDQLLSYDAKLKATIRSLESEIESCRKQIADLKKEDGK